MTVEELITKLQEMPKELTVSYPSDSSGFRLHYNVCEVVVVQFADWQKPFVALRWVDPHPKPR